MSLTDPQSFAIYVRQKETSVLRKKKKENETEKMTVMFLFSFE